MEDIEKNKLIDAIKKTGFGLERKVSLLFENKGWSLINNRYYLDDINSIMREIDIIAYKFYQIKDISFFNSLIISCKKSEKNIWGFLTSPTRNSINLIPMHSWNNSKILNALKYEDELLNFVKDKTKVKEYMKELFLVNKNIFAFQEIKNENGNYKANNDSNIFDSIISIIKALAYEISILGHRKQGTNVIYNFDLLSIFDGRMINYNYTDEEPDIQEIEEISYINRYIINKKDSHYRIHFFKIAKLDSFLEKYDLFIKEQKNFHYKLINKYSEKFKTDYKLTNLFLSEIIKDSISEIKFSIEPYNSKIKLENISYDSDRKILNLELENIDENEIRYLNTNKELIEKMKEIIKKHTYYQGKIRFAIFESIF
jgi:hypothetical protein